MDEVDGSRLTRRLISDSTGDKRRPNEYEELNAVNDETTKQYWGRETRIPWRAIFLAAFLFVFGTALIVLSALIWTGFVVTSKPNDEVWVLLGLGLLMFIPGFYHTRIAYYAYYQREGFTFDDIPDFD